MNETLVTPFSNDPFALVAKAFSMLYPDVHYEAYWEPLIRDQEDGTPVYGLTDFGEDGSIAIFIKTSLEVTNAVEIFAHELAHAAVGLEHDHDNVWEEAFEKIFVEYNKIGEAMFAAADGE